MSTLRGLVGYAGTQLFAQVGEKDKEPTPAEVEEALADLDKRLGFVEAEIKMIQKKVREARNGT